MDKNNLGLLAQNPMMDSGVSDEAEKDYFKSRNGVRFAGTHLIIEVMGARYLDDKARIQKMLKDCVTAAGATLLHMHVHQFNPTGLSGVAVLAESHISIHTWPEKEYAALDIFMCGDANPHICPEVIRHALQPEQIDVQELLRGRTDKFPIK